MTKIKGIIPEPREEKADKDKEEPAWLEGWKGLPEAVSSVPGRGRALQSSVAGAKSEKRKV